jgi:hypothetical protein
MRRFRATLASALAIAVLAGAAPAGARHGRTIKLRFPTFVVPPHSDREVCTFLRWPTNVPYDNASQRIVNVGVRPNFVTHHFLMYAYAGDSQSDFAALEGRIVDSKACLDFGPTDTTRRRLVGGGQSPKILLQLPTGLAQQIVPANDAKGSAIGFILNSHWINSDSRPHRAAVKIRLTPAAPHTVKRLVKWIFEPSANSMIDVEPGQVSNAPNGVWTFGGLDLSLFGGEPPPKGPACVTSVVSHMHKRGKLFEITFTDGAGHAETVLSTTDYADPIPRLFVPPLLVNPGQSLSYRCTHDNGMTTAQKMGCEEHAGVTPGIPLLTAFASGLGFFGGAARHCATDADCAGFGTGRCVPANLVFGATSDDDMCIMGGTYYDVNDQVPAGGDPCDLSLIPTILN